MPKRVSSKAKAPRSSSATTTGAEVQTLTDRLSPG